MLVIRRTRTDQRLNKFGSAAGSLSTVTQAKSEQGLSKEVRTSLLQAGVPVTFVTSSSAPCHFQSPSTLLR
jgi:hypothetical protein